MSMFANLPCLSPGPQACTHACTLFAMCSAMQNLREAIAGYRGRLMHEGNDVKRNALLQVLHYTTHLPYTVACCVLAYTVLL